MDKAAIVAWACAITLWAYLAIDECFVAHTTRRILKGFWNIGISITLVAMVVG